MSRGDAKPSPYHSSLDRPMGVRRLAVLPSGILGRIRPADRRAVGSLVLGGMPLLIVVGFLYSETSLVRADGGIAIGLLAGLVFAGLSVVFAAGRLHRARPWVTGVAFLVSSLGPFVLGHALNYETTKTRAWDYVREDPMLSFPDEWRSLNREENFRRYVGWVTGEEGGGFDDYFRLQAAARFPNGDVPPGSGGRTGFGLHSAYLQWTWHVAAFLLACALAYYVSKPGAVVDENQR